MRAPGDPSYRRRVLSKRRDRATRLSNVPQANGVVVSADEQQMVVVGRPFDPASMVAILIQYDELYGPVLSKIVEVNPGVRSHRSRRLRCSDRPRARYPGFVTHAGFYVVAKKFTVVCIE